MTSSFRLYVQDILRRFGKNTWSGFDAETWSMHRAGLQLWRSEPTTIGSITVHDGMR